MKNLEITDNNDIENEEIKEVIKSLEEAFYYFGINFYLIGARARDLWGQLVIRVGDKYIYVYIFEVM